MSDLTDKIEEALEQIENTTPVELTPEVEQELVAANQRLKDYKESGDRRGYLRALTDALKLYRTLVLPALQKQELRRLRNVLSLAKAADLKEQNGTKLQTS